MGESDHQRLSELMDDELSEFERRRWLDPLLEDPDNRATLGRYRLIGEALRRQGEEPLVHPAFRARVLASIQSEQPIPAATGGASSRSTAPSPATHWKKAFAGLSIAASVALLAIYLGPHLHDRGAGVIAANPPAVTPSAAQLASAPPQPPPVKPAEGTYWETLPPEVEHKLNRYLVEHAEYSSGRAMDRMLPYASFVSYDRNH